MNMTRRQRVLACLEMQRPDRVPRDVWILPIVRREQGEAQVRAFQERWPTDIGGPGWYAPALAKLTKGNWYEPGEFHDEWGCVFDNIQWGIIGQVKQPLVDDWSKLSMVRPPTELLEIDYTAVSRMHKANDQFILAGTTVRPFERLQFLRGSENLFLDIAEDSTEFRELLRIVDGFFIKEMEAWCRADIDGVSFMDDWGSQRSLLIHPQTWRRIFKPLYARYAQIAHAAGKKIFMHSDGCIMDIYEDLIEIGIDAINSQLFCMDIAEIGKRFRGRITFWGELDRQWVLPNGTAADVRAAVQKVVDHLWLPEGGVMAQFELSSGSKVSNADAAFQAWLDLPTRR